MLLRILWKLACIQRLKNSILFLLLAGRQVVLLCPLDDGTKLVALESFPATHRRRDAVLPIHPDQKV